MITSEDIKEAEKNYTYNPDKLVPFPIECKETWRIDNILIRISQICIAPFAIYFMAGLDVIDSLLDIILVLIGAVIITFMCSGFMALMLSFIFDKPIKKYIDNRLKKNYSK